MVLARKGRNLAVMDPNCISYWYPRILALKEEILMPPTDLFAFDFDAACIHWEKGTLATTDLVAFFMQYCGNGVTNFIRNGHTSGKFDWAEACYIPGDITTEQMAQHIHNIIGFHLMHGIGRTNYWAIRQYIQPEILGVMENGMPLAAEYRFFVEDGQIVHQQPYWCPGNADKNVSLESLQSAYAILDQLVAEPRDVALRIGTELGREFRGWSVDMMLGKNGRWYFIDAALAHQSFKWSGQWEKELTT